MSGSYHMKHECNFCGETVQGKDLVSHAEDCRPDKIRTDMWFNHVRKLFYDDNYATENECVK